MMPWTKSWSIGMTANKESIFTLNTPTINLNNTTVYFSKMFESYQIHHYTCTIIMCVVSMVK